MLSHRVEENCPELFGPTTNFEQEEKQKDRRRKPLLYKSLRLCFLVLSCVCVCFRLPQYNQTYPD